MPTDRSNDASESNPSSQCDITSLMAALQAQIVAASMEIQTLQKRKTEKEAEEAVAEEAVGVEAVEVEAVEVEVEAVGVGVEVEAVAEEAVGVEAVEGEAVEVEVEAVGVGVEAVEVEVEAVEVDAVADNASHTRNSITPTNEEITEPRSSPLPRYVGVAAQNSRRAAAGSGSGAGSGAPTQSHNAYTFYDNQQECSRTIQEKFKSVPYVMLLAPMQSGKTGTYLHTALEMVRDGTVSHVKIITGCREKGLRAQCREDLEKAIDQYAHEKQEHPGKFREAIKILWGQDLKKGITFSPLEPNTLIIWEESHYAQDKKHNPNLWFEHHNIHGALQGDFTELDATSSYIMSVSATPFSEIINNHMIGAQQGDVLKEKSVVVLNTADEYRGVAWFSEQGLMNDNFEFKTDTGSAKLKSLLNQFKDRKKYLVFRVVKHHIPIIKQVANQYDMEVKEASMEGDSDILSLIGQDGIMWQAPEKTTVILLKGMCRMGCVVPKSHVGLVFDTGEDGKIDACLQGLVGRMCGTPSPKDPFQDNHPEIYIGKDSRRRMGKYALAFKNGIAPIMDHASNVKKERQKTSQKGKHGYPFIPILLRDAPEWELLEKSSPDAIRKWLYPLLDNHPVWGKNNQNQISQIKEMLRNVNIFGQRHLYTPTNQNTNTLKDMVACHNAGKHTFEYFDNNDDKYNFHYCSWEDDKGGHRELSEKDKALGAQPGDIWITGFTRAQDPDIITTLNGPELPVTTRQEAFNPHECQTEAGRVDETNGGQIFNLSKETSENPSTLETEVAKAIERSRNEDPHTHKISSQWDDKSKSHKGIRLNMCKFKIGDNLGPATKRNPRGRKLSGWNSPTLTAIFERLEKDKRVKISKAYALGRPRTETEYKRLSEISWTFN